MKKYITTFLCLCSLMVLFSGCQMNIPFETEKTLDPVKIGTNQIIGVWDLDYAILEDEVVQMNGSMDVNKDNTAKMVLEGEGYNLHWSYERYDTDEDLYWYKFELNGESITAAIVDDEEHDYYGNLLLNLQNEAGLLFEKE